MNALPDKTNNHPGNPVQRTPRRTAMSDGPTALPIAPCRSGTEKHRALSQLSAAQTAGRAVPPSGVTDDRPAAG